MTVGAELLSTPDPHFIPGYAGHCPQYQFRSGETYGSITHKVLLDPTINHAESLVLSNRADDQLHVRRILKENDKKLNNQRLKNADRDIIYTHPIIPSYEGFIPKIQGKHGQRFTVLATEGVKEFEKTRLKDKQNLNVLEKSVNLQSGVTGPSSLRDKLLLESDYKLPLQEVKPEYQGVIRSVWQTEEYETPKEQSATPYYTRYTGHLPKGRSYFDASLGKTAVSDFSSNFQRNANVANAPITISKPDPPLFLQPSEIYHPHVGLIPNYLGHVPGSKFRCGRTFGAETKDAKRWLRGDFSL